MRPFLNIDLGELPDEPERLYALAEVANIACGGHAGDAASMARAVEACRRHGARVGAHPSYPDREGFGRVRMDVPAETLYEAVAEQCAALAAVGAEVQYVKPHGALYHAAREDVAIAEAVIRAAKETLGTVSVIGAPSGKLAVAAARAGLPYVREGFADRGLRPDGTLVPRGEPGALIDDPAAAAAQAVALARGGRFDTICVHGDGPNALAVAEAVRAALERL